ncbi:efflux RND transporter periplasmic adaptor subunit [Alkalimonas sp.]|uniref:efflux RND transporter periplasmic adaptor subunit n=1 Tax=Alkalimonas sp. TaxID=1872453 RepID=UPI00263B8808|nr:efflux RND transporter periplasmic adaptor subunit [Alkalimonas sp.]MCC5825004.1 efflux RND transporter periplasmic adaptor subunit [Alkalimonas sp.]
MANKPWSNTYWLLAALFIVIIGWFASGDFRSAQQSMDPFQQQETLALPRVETRISRAELMQPELVLQGHVQPFQRVLIQAQLEGTVQQLLVEQGQTVTAAAPLLQLSDEGRSQRLLQAEALVRLREAEYLSAQKLGAEQFLSQTELIRLASELESARTERSHAERQLGYTKPTAPFSGHINRRMVEVGDFVQTGNQLLELVQIERLKVSAQIPQQQVQRVQAGQQVRLTLLDGSALDATVHFVSLQADEATRSFYLEVWADNPDLLRIAGASATLHIQLAPETAHRLSPALLQLTPDGQLAVSVVEAQQVVRYPVQLLQADPQGIWVTGLPEQIELIQTGAGFVRPGDQVLVTRTTEDTRTTE